MSTNTPLTTEAKQRRITETEALAEGLEVLCGPYTDGEAWMLENALRSLRAGWRRFTLVQPDRGGLEVWIPKGAQRE